MKKVFVCKHCRKQVAGIFMLTGLCKKCNAIPELHKRHFSFGVAK